VITKGDTLFTNVTEYLWFCLEHKDVVLEAHLPLWHKNTTFGNSCVVLWHYYILQKVHFFQKPPNFFWK